MLSRRNARIKVMQVLYARAIDDHLSGQDVMLRFDKMVEDNYDLFLFTSYLLNRVILCASDEQEKRQSKHLPDIYDKQFTDRLRTNPLSENMEKNAALNKEWHSRKFSDQVDSDMIRKLYKGFSKEDEYHSYIKKESPTPEDHLQILLSLFREIRKEELFLEIVLNNYPGWHDDSSLVIGSIKRMLKELPSDNPSHYQRFYPDEETVEEFGRGLLRGVLRSEEELLQIIEPTLQNWDKDRLAELDLIFLKMGVYEFIYFHNVPTKVTLNEYVELSKSYSTDKSKEFVNGILDRIMKDLEQAGRIVKKGRGLRS